MNETSEPDNKPVLYEVTFNYNDGTSENVVVYYGDVLSYKSKYYEEGRNLAEVISGITASSIPMVYAPKILQSY